MTRRFNVTYDIVTPESAQHGDSAERGFITPGNWHNDAKGSHGPVAARLKTECAMSLRDALSLINTACLHYDGCGTWHEQDERADYRTGASETRALHCPGNITQASLERVARLVERTR